MHDTTRAASRSSSHSPSQRLPDEDRPSDAPPRTGHRLSAAITVVLLAVVAMLAVLVVQQLAPSDGDSSSGSSWGRSLADELTGGPGVEDGVVEQDVPLPVTDRDHPALTRLDDDLLEALRAAAEDAAADGVSIGVTSGWRSSAYQADLFEDAIDEHGSRDAASRWAATAGTSLHVRGEAVDVGPYDAIDWLRRRGSDHGLCQIYANESWHYELRPEAVTQGCPPMYKDPSEDPRLHK